MFTVPVKVFKAFNVRMPAPVPRSVKFRLVPEMTLVMVIPPVFVIWMMLLVALPKASDIDAEPEPPKNKAIVRRFALELRKMVFATPLTVAPPKVSVDTIVEVSLLPSIIALLPAKSIAPSVSDPFALELLPTPSLEVVLLKLIPRLLPENARVLKLAISPTFPSAMDVA